MLRRIASYIEKSKSFIIHPIIRHHSQAHGLIILHENNIFTLVHSLNRHSVKYFRAYKEALRQQRIQDCSAIYKPKEANQVTPPDGVSPQSTSESTTSTPSMTLNSSSGSQMSPISPLHANSKYSPTTATNGSHNNGIVDAVNNSLNTNGLKSPIRTDKPIQKVIPSRNNTPIKYQQQQQIASPTNGNQPDGKTKEYGIYTKPTSPTKPATSSVNGTLSLGSSAIKSNGSSKIGPKVTR